MTAKKIKKKKVMNTFKKMGAVKVYTNSYSMWSCSYLVSMCTDTLEEIYEKKIKKQTGDAIDEWIIVKGEKKCLSKTKPNIFMNLLQLQNFPAVPPKK